MAPPARARGSSIENSFYMHVLLRVERDKGEKGFCNKTLEFMNVKK